MSKSKKGERPIDHDIAGLKLVVETLERMSPNGRWATLGLIVKTYCETKDDCCRSCLQTIGSFHVYGPKPGGAA